jgi:hypothetical protein
MSKKLVDAATDLAAAFMPAEQAQGEAALGAAKSLVLALEAERDPAFQGGIGHRALIELSHGVDLSVQADVALRNAHTSFARILGRSGLSELGWGCTNNQCPPLPTEGNVERLRQVA